MRVFIAFIISLLVYALLIWLFVTKFSNIEMIPSHKNDHIIKIDIRDIPLPAKPMAAPKVKQPTVATKKPVKKPQKKKPIKKEPIKKKPIVKKKPVKKVIKKKPVKKKPTKKKPIKKKPKVSKKPKEKILYIPNPLQKPKPIKKVEENPDDLASFFSAPQETSSRSFPSNKIRKLYGSSFHSFTPTQKKFIENNLESIQEITQRTLTRRGYPEAAGKTGQQGTNVVSFNLHPNGDISNLRLKTRIGYRSLDDNTLSLIRVAYKDYPYPSTTTKIVFYVTYSIYGY